MGGRPPEGWRQAQFGELIELSVDLRPEGHEPTVLSCSKDRGLVPQLSLFGKRLASADTRRYKRVRPGDFVYDPNLLWNGAIARSHLDHDGIVSPVYEVFRVGADVDARFVETWLRSPLRIADYRRISDGTNTRRRRAAFSELEQLPVHLPPRAEQHAIAIVLNAIDDVVERTEAEVAATTTLLDALLRELFARGVRGRHRLWKHAPGLGQVPACWDVTTVGAVSEHVTKGATPTTFGHKWAASGAVFLRSECVGEGVLLPAAAMKITQAAHDGMKRSHIRDGDILMTITGYIGRVCRVPDGFGEASINQHIARIRVPPNRETNTQFTYWALMSPRTRRALRDQVTGLAYPQIGLAEVRSIVLPVPPPDEQMEIAAALEGAALRVTAELGRLTRLRVLKQATADALLTGRLRVAATVRPGPVVAR